MTKETTCYVEVSEQDALDLMVKLGAFVHARRNERASKKAKAAAKKGA